MHLPRLVALVALILPICALADPTTYTYAGNDFTIVSGAYTTGDSVTGEFTLNAPLADNLTTLTYIDLTSFSFSDGVQTLTQTNAPLGPTFFDIETNSTGMITEWYIDLQSTTGGALETVNDPSLTVEDDAFSAVGSEGLSLFSAGSWTATEIAPTPEPASLLLAGTALIATAAFGRRLREARGEQQCAVVTNHIQ